MDSKLFLSSKLLKEKNISHGFFNRNGGTSNGICTLTFDISVSKWGRKDVDVAIDLNDLLTLSA